MLYNKGEYKKEWCFLDKTYTTWSFCKPLNQSQETYLIKNLMPDQKTSFCMYKDPENAHNILAIDCLMGISNPKNVVWGWNSLNNEIYSEDTTHKLCVNNLTLSLCSNSTDSSFWFMDAYGRIIERNTGYCLVVSESLIDNKFRKIYLGRCEGFVNKKKLLFFLYFFLKDYQSKEIWIKTEYNNETFDNMRVKLEIQKWKNNIGYIKEIFSRNQG